MYSSLPHFILGFHGCDQEICNKVLNKTAQLRFSQRPYDWLGHGAYFWENDPDRALAYAQHIKDNPRKSHSKIKKPAVIGAIIDLGNCLNLLDKRNLQILRESYELVKKIFDMTKRILPENHPIGKEKDLLLRPLDCLVIEATHAFNKARKKKEYDSVRGVFWEGNELYPNAGFKEKDHIQVCVKNPNCIKGYFLPRNPSSDYPLP